MSFNYTPPPPEVEQIAKVANWVLCAALMFVPKVWQGAVIGCLGAVVIFFIKEGYAGGDLGGIYQIIGIPFAGAFGIIMGGGASFIGQKLRPRLAAHFTGKKRPM